MSKDSSLKEIVHALINSEDYKEIYENVHKLHNIFASATGIVAGNVTDKDIYLECGKAISPIKAAHCLLEIDRTRRFLRGIYKAILQLKTHFSGPVNILYAGTGPYSTLILPLTDLFSSGEIRLYLLDINSEALEAVKTLYQKRNLMSYVEEFILADAAEYTPPQGITMHLMISETMQNALKKEPQVAIMKNLLPHLPQKGIFIPQEIKIDAILLNNSKEFQRFFDADILPQRLSLGSIFEIGMNNRNPPSSASIQVPADLENYDELSLFTEIKVYNDEKLTAYNSGLNIPVPICKVDACKGKSVSFEYIMGRAPHFEYTILEN